MMNLLFVAWSYDDFMNHDQSTPTSVLLLIYVPFSVYVCNCNLFVLSPFVTVSQKLEWLLLVCHSPNC